LVVIWAQRNARPASVKFRPGARQWRSGVQKNMDESTTT
jgi:hypothetical protein